jgi:hypothetical protein
MHNTADDIFKEVGEGIKALGAAAYASYEQLLGKVKDPKNQAIAKAEIKKWLDTTATCCKASKTAVDDASLKALALATVYALEAIDKTPEKYDKARPYLPTIIGAACAYVAGLMANGVLTPEIVSWVASRMRVAPGTGVAAAHIIEEVFGEKDPKDKPEPTKVR